MLVANATTAFVKGLFGSPMGRALLVLVAFLAWTGYQRQDAATQAVAEFKQAVNEASEAEHQRQIRVSAKLAEEALLRAETSEQRAADMEAQRDEIIQELRDSPAGDCPIPDDVRRRLLRIGG